MKIEHNVLVAVYNSDIKNSTFEIPASVTSIGRSAFYYCRKLKSIMIPEGVTSIGFEAFYNCSNLTSPVNNYKAFLLKDGNLIAQQNNKKYNFGHKSYARGELKPCENGLHYCTNIFDIFNYYSGEYGEDFVIALCDVSEENIGHDEDSKRCARWVKPTRILTREEVIRIMNGEELK